MIDAGCSFTLETTPSDELIPYISEMKEMCISRVGALCHITVARDERDPKWLPILTDYNREEYKKIWSEFDSALFQYKMSVFGVKRNEFCYAGDWSFYLNLATGIKTQCYCSYFKENIFENPNKPINFRPIGNMCSEHHCYNAHVFLSLGNIPSLDSPTYDILRNRKCSNNSEWVNSTMKSFMHGKLRDSNQEYSEEEKNRVNRLNKLAKYENRAKSALIRIKSLITR